MSATGSFSAKIVDFVPKNLKIVRVFLDKICFFAKKTTNKYGKLNCLP